MDTDKSPLPSHITVAQLLSDKKDDLKLETFVCCWGHDKKITLPEPNRPGLTLAGFFKYFRHQRVQVLGLGEMGYLNSISPKRQEKILRKFFSYKLPLVIVTRNSRIPDNLLVIAKKRNICVLRSSLSTTVLVSELSDYLSDCLAPTVSMHGVLVGVYGTGILITGESGIGKSEVTLELLKRGHQLVCDDFIKVKHLPGNRLIGKGSEIAEHNIEVRGIGIVDVRRIFGIGATLRQARIEMVINLEEYDKAKEIDRAGQAISYENILGVNIPKSDIAVKPGRNIAILIEIAVMNRKLLDMGINTAEELDRRLIDYISRVKKK